MRVQRINVWAKGKPETYALEMRISLSPKRDQYKPTAKSCQIKISHGHLLLASILLAHRF